MSQAGIIDFIGTHPEIPILFVANVGSAVPIANTLEILGDVVAAHGIPLETVGSGNTISINVQYASAAATSVAGNAGVASFSSIQFNVDANGFVSLSNIADLSVAVDTFTAPGTNPVVPTAAGVITVTGSQVPAGTTANVIRTDSLAANSYTIQIQRSQAVASSTVADNGVSHFNSAFFTVDSNGFVSLNGSAVGETITGNTGGALTPTAGNWNIFGAAVAAGTAPVATSGTGSTLTVNVQRAQAIASTNASNVGLAAFDSAAFDVDANGFVQLNAGGIAITSLAIDGNTAPGTNPVVPTAAGQVTITGAQVASGTTANVVRAFSVAANAYQMQIQRSTSAASSTVGSNGVSHFHSTDFSVDSNAFVSIAVQFTGNTGTAAFAAGNLNILGANGVTTSATGSTVTINGTANVQTFVATSNNYTFTWTAPAERTLYDVQFAVASGGVAGGGTYATFGLFTKVMTLYMLPATVSVTPITIIAQQADSNVYSCPITAVGALNSGITVNVLNANTFTVVVTAVKIGSY